MSPSTSPTVAASRGIYLARVRRPCAGRRTRPRRSRVILARPIAPTTSKPPRSLAATGPASRSRASSCDAAITRCANSEMTRSHHLSSSRGPARVAPPRATCQAAASPRQSRQQPTTPPVLWPLDPDFGSAISQPVPAGPERPTPTSNASRASWPSLTPMRRGQLHARSCRHDHVDGLHRLSGRNASPSGINRGRDASCPTPPAQIPACASNALGSSLGSWRRSAGWARGEGCGVPVAIAQRGGRSASR